MQLFYISVQQNLIDHFVRGEEGVHILWLDGVVQKGLI